MQKAEELYAEHLRINAVLQDLLDATGADEARLLQQQWEQVEKELLAHFEYEETQLFPSAEKTLPDLVASLRADHVAFRKLIADLGVRSDLHTFRRHAAEELVRRLRDHAETESTVLYPVTVTPVAGT